MRASLLSMTFLLAAACSRTESGLEVTVTVDTALDIDQLRFTLAADGEDALKVNTPDPPKALTGKTHSAGFFLPDAFVDTDVSVTVRGMAGDAEVARGSGDVATQADTIVKLSITLEPPPDTCGNGAMDADEACDDANTSADDGCSATCTVEAGYACSGEPSVCLRCGDGAIDGDEACDDQNGGIGDGCTPACVVEPGWTCTGEPSACAPICGDGERNGTEPCDDGDVLPDDGCSATCAIELGWDCDDLEPSSCATSCGDGATAGTEPCDDGDLDPGDGCSATCTLETGWTCVGSPSTCTPTCGDSALVGAEPCDDGRTDDGDGCSAVCALEPGWQCAGSPTTCVSQCGDGFAVGLEACDDGDLDPGDGCDALCAEELGYDCTGQPSVCAGVCGDGVPIGNEACDDGVLNSDTTPDACRLDCTLPVCGDGVSDGLFGEGCDDANTDNTDGCLTGCRAPACGDGFVLGAEACDDGGSAPGDGCGATCAVEAGFDCAGAPSLCALFADTWFVPGDFTTVENAVGNAAVNNGDLIIVTANTNADDANLNKSVRVVGTGQTLQGNANNSATIEVSGGAAVLLQGLTLRNTGNNQSVVDLLSGALTLRDVRITQSDGDGIDQAAGTTLVLERSVVSNMPNGGLSLRGSYTVESSVLVDNAVRGAQIVAGASGTFAFNTVVGSPVGVSCAAAADVSATILFDNLTDVQGCATPDTLIGVDPLFSADGLHLEPTSPALNAGPLATCPAFDIDRDARPIGAGCDVGADERP